MRNAAVTLLAIVSLLLCAAAVVFWIRSYDPVAPACDHFEVRGMEVYSLRGSLTVASPRKPTTSKTVVSTAPDGSEIVTHYFESYAPTHKVLIPYFLIVITTAVLPIAWLTYFSRPLRRRRLRLAGKCPTCGYDLTGNTSGVCPECVAAIRK